MLKQKTAIISGSNISFSYEYDDNFLPALRNLDFEIKRGDFIVILGRNGCGKSTLVKHFNALLPLQKGRLEVAGLNVADEKIVWQLRRICGMVFQNPDNQFVSSLVEEDIAFGLENYEVARDEIKETVNKALETVGMKGYEKRSPHTLSGGQKQRIALATVFALNPEIIIFDEVTSMLDPKGRNEMLEVIKHLHQDLGKTIIMITHYVEEAVFADKILLMQKGEIIREGSPHEILINKDLMEKAELSLPIPVKLYYDLLESGVKLKSCPITNDELVENICQLK